MNTNCERDALMAALSAVMRGEDWTGHDPEVWATAQGPARQVGRESVRPEALNPDLT